MCLTIPFWSTLLPQRTHFPIFRPHSPYSPVADFLGTRNGTFTKKTLVILKTGGVHNSQKRTFKIIEEKTYFFNVSGARTYAELCRLFTPDCCLLKRAHECVKCRHIFGFYVFLFHLKRVGLEWVSCNVVATAIHIEIRTDAKQYNLLTQPYSSNLKSKQRVTKNWRMNYWKSTSEINSLKFTHRNLYRKISLLRLAIQIRNSGYNYGN